MKAIMQTVRGLRGAALAGAVLAAGGCAQIGQLGNVLGGLGTGQQQGEVQAEVRYVDTQRQTIQVATSNGQVGNVYFDSRTQVVYQQQRYPVTALEQGDVVTMRIQQDQRGNAYTDYILVNQSVQERGGGLGGGVYDDNDKYGGTRLEGRVDWVNYDRGEFLLRTSRGNVTVTLPYNPGTYNRDRFRTLRNGDYVRVEGRLISQSRFELTRFL
jgi:hypothetical protein